MTTNLRPDEVSAILKQQLADFQRQAHVYESGTVLSVGDGIARVYGLEHVMAGELISFSHNVMGVALNLEETNVGVAIFGDVALEIGRASCRERV